MAITKVEINMDWWKENTGKTEFEIIPEGQYPVMIAEGQYTTPEGRTPRIEWRFRILKGDFANHIIFHNSYLTEGATKRLRWLCNTVDYEPDDGVIDIHDMIGRELQVTVKHTEWNQKTRVEVERYDKIGASNSSSTGLGRPVEVKLQADDEDDGIPF